MPTAHGDVAAASRPRSRKSIAHMPSPDNGALLMDKENMTVDTSAITAKATSKLQKRSRSKSLGPGGIEALKEDAGNRRKTVIAVPKSILKPAIPLSPLKEIPARKPTKAAQSPTRSPARKNIPINTNGGLSLQNQRISPQPLIELGQDPLGNEETEEEKRKKEKEQAIKARDARRKSLANRRVSFAPEATLHTWDMLEEMHDSTTSTATSNSTRRASEMSNGFEDTLQAPGGPGDIQVAASPAEQQDVKDKKRRRRSSGIPPMNFNNPDDALSSSPVTGSSDVGDDIHSDEDDTVSEGAARDVFTAAQEDAIIGSNEATEDVSMEMAGDEITTAFRPWAQNMQVDAARESADFVPLEQGNFNPFSPAFKGAALKGAATNPNLSMVEEEEDMSMDITRVIGGIKSTAQQKQGRRQSVRNRRRSSGSSFGGETMELTTAIGGIHSQSNNMQEDSQLDTAEDLSMEFTAVVGGIQGRVVAQQQQIGDETSMEDGGTMDMTAAIGGILPKASTVAQEVQEDTMNVDMDMDVTTAIGGIIARPQQSQQPPSATDVETKKAAASPAHTSLRRKSVMASETGSPTVTTRSPRRRSAAKADHFLSTPAKSPSTPSTRSVGKAPRPITPGKTPPTKNATLQRESTPKKLFQEELLESATKKTGFTPIGAQSLRFDATAENTMANAYPNMSPAKRRASGFGLDKAGLGSPRVAALLDRRTSIGEKAGTFTPSKLGARAIRFADPKDIEAEITKEHQQEERRESGQFIMEREVDGDEEDFDHTATLKEAIGNMTPKKTPQKKNLKGRKSLAPGGALGLLGKRPRELDEASDEDGTPQGLRGREASPVKRIRLQAPPTKAETIGKLVMSADTNNVLRASTPIEDLAPNIMKAATPTHKGHFKNVEALPSAKKPLPSMGQQSGIEEEPTEEEEEVVQKIHLQDFLNMTSIRFIELNTTKRRHTVAPTEAQLAQAETEADPAKQFEDAVVAGACTIPMLELFQHSCRELKKYIAEGRGVIREIEADTFEENPPLFREYMSASPAERTVMDNQFKQMKAHARHLSKGMWYEWRMKLLEGLRGALNSTAEGMTEDAAALQKQEQTIQKILPGMVAQYNELVQQNEVLQAHAAEFDSSRQGELDEARQQLIEVDTNVTSKKNLIEQYKQELKSSVEAVAQIHQEKINCQQATRDAQRVREELRGWSVAEVNTLKTNVDALEAKHGWRIASASGTTLTMTYRNDLQLFFDTAAFGNSATASENPRQNAPISLTYIGDDTDLQRRPQALTTQARFFLQFMRAHLQCLNQSSTSLSTLLSFVSTGWDKTKIVSREVCSLDFSARTDCAIRSDEKLEVCANVVLPVVGTKMLVDFEVFAAVENMEMSVKVLPRAKVVYGEKYKEDRMTEFLRGRVDKVIGVAGSGSDGVGSWADAVKDLRNRLVAQGRKGEGKA